MATQTEVLTVIQSYPEGVDINKLAEEFKVKPFSLTKVLADLRKKGSVVKEGELYRSRRNSAPSSHREITFARGSKRYHIECFLVQHPFGIPLMPHFLVSLEEYHLTKREMEIAQSVAEGLTNKEIAEKLFISQFTVETHLKNIFEKIGTRNRTELATYIKSPLDNT